MTIFAELGLNKTLQANIKRLGYKTPTNIQKKSIGAVLSGADTYAIAPTGTGKTAAYLLPTLQELSQTDHSNDEIRPIRAVYLVPTRELAQQLELSIANYGKDLNLRTISIFGGVRIESQVKRFKRGADIVIATPKRLVDLLKLGTFSLDKIKHFVMDEADRLVSMGIQQELRTILTALPKKRQIVLFSATDSKTLAKFSKDNLSHQKEIKTEQQQPAQSKIVHTMYRCYRKHKTGHLISLLTMLNCDRALIFTRTKQDVKELTQLLTEKGLSNQGIHNEVAQKRRQERLTGFKNGEFKFLVATDIASRGIDFDDLYYVINFDLPVNSNDYIHRAGRTARKSVKQITNSEKVSKQNLSKDVITTKQFEFSDAPKVTVDDIQGHVFSLVCPEQERLVPKIANTLNTELKLDKTPW
ncbi:DEAD/DEAH box helicase [Pseudoalteromonas denitrificans]|uniref:ATP-dependent RNA helicase RhlE n=1 Tax=Pseudoalteromonas denitrificans DSM 6059 TaxID=1123010 RepID=A0A1I1KTY6_9GAMM|nr:DEAD/DEAH box helicase [Pseudoalteromonas denitrificans]SFC64287.1 ATP-dependent RNA helicase RhlE [Pseudoalteromonas denitrificans DSM 6059]